MHFKVYISDSYYHYLYVFQTSVNFQRLYGHYYNKLGDSKYMQILTFIRMMCAVVTIHSAKSKYFYNRTRNIFLSSEKTLKGIEKILLRAK